MTGSPRIREVAGAVRRATRRCVRAGCRAAPGALVALLALVAAWPAEAQLSCTRNNRGTCTVGGTNGTIALNITVTRAVRMSLGSTTVTLTQPGAAEFDAGFGQTAAPTFVVKANAPFSVSLRSTQATWTASPAPARANKPVTDLQWGVAVGGPFTNVTTTAVTIHTGGAASAGTTIPLQFRVRYDWLLDTPGTYSLPLQLTITAP